MQREVAAFLDLALPDNSVWWHTPNGRKRSKADAGRLKAEGAKSGVADCIVIYEGLVIGIELKMPRNYPSQEQKDFATSLRCAGGVYYVARSVEEVVAVLEKEGVPLRARLS